MEYNSIVALVKLGASFAACLVVVAAGSGISKIGVQALESVARQPQAANDIRSNTIVAAALIEGLAFFAIIVAMLVLFLV